MIDDDRDEMIAMIRTTSTRALRKYIREEEPLINHLTGICPDAFGIVKEEETMVSLCKAELARRGEL
jgi:hypothetical protein